MFFEEKTPLNDSASFLFLATTSSNRKTMLSQLLYSPPRCLIWSFIILFGIIGAVCALKYRPVVLWHGMGDTCCYSWSMGRIQKLIESQLPGVYVNSIMVGQSVAEDELNSFFMNVNDQVQFVCDKLATDPNLKKGFNAIGFSQGSQFFRAYIERCNSPPVYNFITIGGQHQGVFGFPRCPGSNEICEIIREMLDYGVYVSWVQNHLVQAEYWHDPLNEEQYLKYCIFLPDVNNALPQKNSTYKRNLMSLNNFTMVKFTEDGMVQPTESEWFGFYTPGQDQKVTPLRESPLYIEDWLGLQQMDKQNKLHFLSVRGDHMQFTDQWFIENIIRAFLNNTLPS
jgi:palmitoyl-protein thioesterase